jgi:hypothetical protein
LGNSLVRIVSTAVIFIGYLPEQGNGDAENGIAESLRLANSSQPSGK